MSVCWLLHFIALDDTLGGGHSGKFKGDRAAKPSTLICKNAIHLSAIKPLVEKTPGLVAAAASSCSFVMYYAFWYGFLFFPVLLQNFRQCQSSGKHCQLWTRVGKLHETRCGGLLWWVFPWPLAERMMTAFQTLCRIISHPCSTINQNWCGKTRPTERFISVLSSNSQASAIKHEWSLPWTSLGYSFILLTATLIEL